MGVFQIGVWEGSHSVLKLLKFRQLSIFSCVFAHKKIPLQPRLFCHGLLTKTMQKSPRLLSRGLFQTIVSGSFATYGRSGWRFELTVFREQKKKRLVSTKRSLIPMQLAFGKGGSVSNKRLVSTRRGRERIRQPAYFIEILADSVSSFGGRSLP